MLNYMSELDNCKALELWFPREHDGQNNGSGEEYKLPAEQICPMQDHKKNVRRISWIDFIQISTERRQLNTVESISLVTETSRNYPNCNKKLTAGNVKRIIETCPNLICLAIIKTSFTRDGWIYLVNEIFPVIQTLSISDEICVYHRNIRQSIDWTKDIQMLTNLQDLKLLLTKIDCKFDSNCLQYLTENLVSFYIRDISGVNYLTNIIQNLNVGMGRLLQFLRIETDEKKRTVIDAYKYIAQLKQLRGLNLSVRNYINIECKPIELYYICELDNLETITIKFYKPDETAHVLDIVSSGKFKHKLTRLKLIWAELDLIGFNWVFNGFKNLECLQLIDTDLDNLDQILHLMVYLPNFKELTIEKCPDFKFRHVVYAVKYLSKLETIRIDSCLSDQDQLELNLLAEQLSTDERQIEIYF